MGCGLWVVEYDTVSLMMGKRARSGEMRNEKREMRIMNSGRHTGRYSKYRYRRPRPGARPADATRLRAAPAPAPRTETRAREDARTRARARRVTHTVDSLRASALV